MHYCSKIISVYMFDALHKLINCSFGLCICHCRGYSTNILVSFRNNWKGNLNTKYVYVLEFYTYNYQVPLKILHTGVPFFAYGYIF